jgi:hypothetical protein
MIEELNYEPTSDFLKAAAAGRAPLSGNEFADANLEQVIRLTHDDDRSNRDWATFILAYSGIDTIPVREALLHAARDEFEDTRAEAICGLAQRDCALALPLLQEALRGQTAATPLFEAAEICAHPSLIESLRFWVERYSDGSHYNLCAIEALAACEKASGTL